MTTMGIVNQGKRHDLLLFGKQMARQLFRVAAQPGALVNCRASVQGDS